MRLITKGIRFGNEISLAKPFANLFLLKEYYNEVIIHKLFSNALNV